VRGHDPAAGVAVLLDDVPQAAGRGAAIARVVQALEQLHERRHGLQRPQRPQRSEQRRAEARGPLDVPRDPEHGCGQQLVDVAVGRQALQGGDHPQAPVVHLVLVQRRPQASAHGVTDAPCLAARQAPNLPPDVAHGAGGEVVEQGAHV